MAANFAKLPELLRKSGSQKRHLIVAGRTRSLPRANAAKNSGGVIDRAIARLNIEHYRRKLVTASRNQRRRIVAWSTWED
jgi:hypothetical protein